MNNNKLNKPTDKPSVIQTKKAPEKKKEVLRTKRNVDKNNNIKNDTKVMKDKQKNEGKDNKIISSLENKSHLSVSDLSLNQSKDEKNEMISTSSPLRNSVSNQDINQIIHTEDRPLTNLSSEESIFDSALAMADPDERDSRMYSTTNINGNHELFVSPLDRNQSVSPSRVQREYCTDNCRTMQSRCGHKLHFKTMPAQLGKVDVAHVGSRVDSRRDHRYADNVRVKERVRRVRKVRPSSDGFKSIDPNIITQTVEKSLRK